jgi:hypothetical protein
MAMRNLVLSLVLGLFGLAAGPAAAQSVFLPSDDKPVAAQPEPTAPQVTAPAPFTKPNTVGATRSVAPRMAQRGTTTGAAVPTVRGMSPEQIAQARQAFEALAAKNPQIAAINPFARVEADTAVRALQKDIGKRVREACKLKFFNVMISNDVASNKAVFANIKGYGSSAVVSAMGNLCGDEKLKKSLEEGVGVFNIKHKAGQVEPDIDGGVMMLTFTYDFTSPEPPKMPVLRKKLEKAMEVTTDGTTAAYNSFQEIDQDEMDRRMEKSLGNR